MHEFDTPELDPLPFIQCSIFVRTKCSFFARVQLFFFSFQTRGESLPQEAGHPVEVVHLSPRRRRERLPGSQGTPATKS